MFGDYDVDGAASVALIERFLRAHGQTPATYIPDRLTEGYGPSADALAGLAKDGARLILTVDCGTTAEMPLSPPPMRPAREVIVIDHHQADEALPPAFAVSIRTGRTISPAKDISPRRASCFCSLSPPRARFAEKATIATGRSPTCSACSISWRLPRFATSCRSETRTAPSSPRG